MKIRFVGHASIFVESQNQKILCDPWLVGKVFNDGWALTSPSSPPLFSDVDYIWISHEHPDHFNFPSLKSIPAADKSRITILYQRHASPRIVDALLKMGFSHIIELPQYKWYQLTPDLKVFCGSAGSMDSFIVFRDKDECVLNLNDCVLNTDQLRYIQRRIGKVSLLFTQFSFANWVGNKSDETHGAERKLQQLKQQIDIFKPEFTIPFASFVYFCNEENCRMNAWINTPDAIAQMKLKGINFMYPGDEWNSSVRKFNTNCALEKYRANYANVKIDPTPEPVDIERIREAVKNRLQETKEKVPGMLLKKLSPFSIYIHDLNKVVEVDPARTAYQIVEGDAKQAQAARYMMCSQVVWFIFAFPWGGSTTQISGMYLDREFAEKGSNSFFWVQNTLSTEIFRFNNIHQALRTMNFWWRKKGEMIFRFVGSLRGRGVDDD